MPPRRGRPPRRSGAARWKNGRRSIAQIPTTSPTRCIMRRLCAPPASARRRWPCWNRPSIKNPHDKALLGAYGRALAEIGNYNQAFEVFSRAHTPDMPDWRLLSAQGAVLDQLGRYEEARRYYASALKIVPDEPSVLSNLGLSYALSKDLKQAESTLRRATAQPGVGAACAAESCSRRGLAGPLCRGRGHRARRPAGGSSGSQRRLPSADVGAAEGRHPEARAGTTAQAGVPCRYSRAPQLNRKSGVTARAPYLIRHQFDDGRPEDHHEQHRQEE